MIAHAHTGIGHGARLRGRAGARGITLIEVLVTLAIVAVLAGGMMIGLGTLTSAKLRESSTQVAGAMRLAYDHANATSRPTRLVFDFSKGTIAIEESNGRMLLQSGERMGGAAAATELEKTLLADAEEIVEGPKAPRPRFSPVKEILGFELDEESNQAVKRLREGIEFRLMEVQHAEDPIAQGRAYIYFFPGGLAERAVIQIQEKGAEDDDDIISISIAPLTGKTEILGGPVEMPRPTTDAEASEREDNL